MSATVKYADKEMLRSLPKLSDLCLNGQHAVILGTVAGLLQGSHGAAQVRGCLLGLQRRLACKTHNAADALRDGGLLCTSATGNIVVSVRLVTRPSMVRVDSNLPTMTNAAASWVLLMCVPPQNSTENCWPSTVDAVPPFCDSKNKKHELQAKIVRTLRQ